MTMFVCFWRVDSETGCDEFKFLIPSAGLAVQIDFQDCDAVM